MLKKYGNFIIIFSVIVLFGAVLYIFQNTEGLRSFAGATQDSVCRDKYGAGWYAKSKSSAPSGYECNKKLTLQIPVIITDLAAKKAHCAQQGYIYNGFTQACEATQFEPYPATSPIRSNPKPTPKPAPVPAPAPGPTPSANASTIKISPANLPTGQVGKHYPTTILKVDGGVGPYSWDTPGGQMPPGIQFVDGADNTQKIIAGEPTSSGTFNWSIGIRDKTSSTPVQKSFQIVVNDVNGNPPAAGSGSGGSGDTGTGTASGTIDVAGFNNPLNVEDIPSFLVRIINILLSVVGILAVLFIIYGGLRYITSSGNQTAVTAAKNTVIYALLGLIVSVLSFAIVQVLTNLLINK